MRSTAGYCAYLDRVGLESDLVLELVHTRSQRCGSSCEHSASHRAKPIDPPSIFFWWSLLMFSIRLKRTEPFCSWACTIDVLNADERFDSSMWALMASRRLATPLSALPTSSYSLCSIYCYLQHVHSSIYVPIYVPIYVQVHRSSSSMPGVYGTRGARSRRRRQPASLPLCMSNASQWLVYSGSTAKQQHVHKALCRLSPQWLYC